MLGGTSATSRGTSQIHPKGVNGVTLAKGGIHLLTYIYTYTQHTQHTHKVHLCIYSVVCAVQRAHTICQVTCLDLPCRWKHKDKLQPPVCLLVSSVWQCLSSSPSATLNYPGGEAVPHLHQMVSHINIAVS